MADLKIFAKTVEPQALEQINTLVAQPAFSDCKVRIMPDVHAGAGCVIGFTANLGDKIIPNIVGVDIGCGMYTVCIGRVFERPEDFAALDTFIRREIPSGFAVHSTQSIVAFDAINSLNCKTELKNRDHLLCSLGTLGGGNHFIEVAEDKDGIQYLIIHTGSRNLGKQVADIYQRKAIRSCGKETRDQLISEFIAECKQNNMTNCISSGIERIKRTFPKIPDSLAYLENDLAKDYLEDMQVCIRFASENRFRIAYSIQRAIGYEPIFDFETIHNYIDESGMVRKGAVAAHAGEKLLIPMNMRDGSLLCVGKGNPDWNCSAPHGAGRIMSRATAFKELDEETYRREMSGIYSTSVGVDTLDESPMAYKPMSDIISAIGASVEIQHILKPIYNFKAPGR